MHNYRSSMLRVALCTAALSLAASLSAADAAPAPAFAISAKQIDVTGAKYIKVSKRIYLPTVYVEVMNWGKITAVTQTSALQSLGGAANSTSRSTMEVAVPADLAVLRAIAADLYNDLASKLTAAGWEVVRYETEKAHPVMAGVKQEKPDEKFGAPIRKINLGKQKTHYTIAAPEGMPVIDPGMTAPLWGIRNLLKEKNFSALETLYRFDPVALQAESRHGIASNTASTNAKANLVLTFGQAAFLNPKFAGGSVRTKGPLVVEGSVGEIKKAADVSPEFANGLSKALSILGGGGSISSQKGLYVCELNPDALKAHLLVAGKAFNDEIVKGLGAAP